MESILELVKKRYSVRSFLDKEVDDSLIGKVLEVARWAPSAVNNQPWVYIVLKRQESLKQLESVYNRDWFLKAPVVIAVCCDHSLSWKRQYDKKDFGDIDIAITMDHITLAATELGLGTCWVGAFNPDHARKVLMVPSHIEPLVFTPLGYPAATEVAKKRKSLDELVNWEYYGGKKSHS